jgi:ATP-binding cassette subfamily F protein uup
MIVRNFSTILWRGDKVGLIGPNGGGKTTLLKLLLGQLSPDTGVVKPGTNLQVVYLDQLRGQIDDAKTVAQNVAGDAETVTFQGRPRHIHSYLQDFLFRSDAIRRPAKMLSGGERNRLLLARLFLQPANVLVLDEPTNDLDAETMELLEELLVEFSGTLLLVSHDRVFLDNVVTSTLVFEGQGQILEYSGGYQDWIKQRAASPPKPVPLPSPVSTPAPSPVAAPLTPKGKIEKPRKFLNRERKELGELPAVIEKLETEQKALAARLWDPEVYKKEPAKVPELKAELEALEERARQAYARWEELEALRLACEAEA